VNAPAGSLLANAQLNNAAAGAGQPQADAITDAVQQASQQHAQHVNAGWDKLRAFVHEHQTKTDNQLKSIVEQLIQLKAGIDSAQ
jgi:phosphoribosylformylglycinamidine (FGAM) synthase PurS component